MTRARIRLLLATALGAVLLAGCAGVPQDGPVVETGSQGGVAADQGTAYNPRPPQEGDTRADIVRGFLNAMTATPIQTNTAREFLSEDAAAAWAPEDETITYASYRVQESAGGVKVTLADPDRLDARGAWRGSLPRKRRTMDFPMAFEDGEWRVDLAPNALIVPESWFSSRFRQVSLYYFDPTASILAPEPVYVPRGKQLASALTQALLLGPAAGLDRVVQTFIPAGLKLGLSVPITDDGTADIALKGNAGDLSPQATELMMAQLAWTLRQDPAIESLRVSVNGDLVPLPGGVGAYAVDSSPEYDPAGFGASPLIYGLRDGVLASGNGGQLEPVSGPLGTTDLGLRSVGVSLSARLAAGITEDGGTVLEASVSGSDDTDVRPVLTGGQDLAPPGWDAAGRMWLMDRTASGAEFSWVRDDVRRTVQVPGISGRQVRSFVVSRDGTRLVAVVRGQTGDAVLVSRLAHNRGGRVLFATRARAIGGEPDSDLPIRAIAWRSPVNLAILSPFPGTTDLVQLRTASVDGSPPPDGSSTTLRERIRSLVGSPVPDEPLLGFGPQTLVNLGGADPQQMVLSEDAAALTYVG